MNNLAAPYRNLGRAEQAVKLCEETLEIRTRTSRHSAEHERGHGLAASYWSLGRAEQDTKLHKETLEIRTRALGPEHPDTLLSMNNVAASYRSLERAEQAVKLDEEMLE